METWKFGVMFDQDVSFIAHIKQICYSQTYIITVRQTITEEGEQRNTRGKTNNSV